MENNLDLIKKELIHFDVQAVDSEAFFNIVCKELEAKNYVYPSFLPAIQHREKEYPTGLQLQNIAIAIPHTDVQHVINPFISINKLANPIVFTQMGTDDQFIKVEYILILGIKEPKKQVDLLASLMSIFADEEFIQKFQQCQTTDAMYQLFNTIK